MSGYFVVRADGVISNAVEWDGQTVFEVDGCTLIPIPDGCPAWIGWRVNGDMFELPALPEST